MDQGNPTTRRPQSPADRVLRSDGDYFLHRGIKVPRRITDRIAMKPEDFIISKNQRQILDAIQVWKAQSNSDVSCTITNPLNLSGQGASSTGQRQANTADNDCGSGTEQVSGESPVDKQCSVDGSDGWSSIRDQSLVRFAREQLEPDSKEKGATTGTNKKESDCRQAFTLLNVSTIEDVCSIGESSTESLRLSMDEDSDIVQRSAPKTGKASQQMVVSTEERQHSSACQIREVCVEKASNTVLFNKRLLSAENTEHSSNQAGFRILRPKQKEFQQRAEGRERSHQRCVASPSSSVGTGEKKDNELEARTVSIQVGLSLRMDGLESEGRDEGNVDSTAVETGHRKRTWTDLVESSQQPEVSDFVLESWTCQSDGCQVSGEEMDDFDRELLACANRQQTSANQVVSPSEYGKENEGSEDEVIVDESLQSADKIEQSSRVSCVVAGEKWRDCVDSQLESEGRDEGSIDSTAVETGHRKRTWTDLVESSQQPEVSDFVLESWTCQSDGCQVSGEEMDDFDRELLACANRQQTSANQVVSPSEYGKENDVNLADQSTNGVRVHSTQIDEHPLKDSVSLPALELSPVMADFPVATPVGSEDELIVDESLQSADKIEQSSRGSHVVAGEKWRRDCVDSQLEKISEDGLVLPDCNKSLSNVKEIIIVSSENDSTDDEAVASSSDGVKSTKEKQSVGQCLEKGRLQETTDEVLEEKEDKRKYRSGAGTDAKNKHGPRVLYEMVHTDNKRRKKRMYVDKIQSRTKSTVRQKPKVSESLKLHEDFPEMAGCKEHCVNVSSVTTYKHKKRLYNVNTILEARSPEMVEGSSCHPQKPTKCRTCVRFKKRTEHRRRLTARCRSISVDDITWNSTSGIQDRTVSHQEQLENTADITVTWNAGTDDEQKENEHSRNAVKGICRFVDGYRQPNNSTPGRPPGTSDVREKETEPNLSVDLPESPASRRHRAVRSELLLTSVVNQRSFYMDTCLDEPRPRGAGRQTVCSYSLVSACCSADGWKDRPLSRNIPGMVSVIGRSIRLGTGQAIPSGLCVKPFRRRRTGVCRPKKVDGDRQEVTYAGCCPSCKQPLDTSEPGTDLDKPVPTDRTLAPQSVQLTSAMPVIPSTGRSQRMKVRSLDRSACVCQVYSSLQHLLEAEGMTVGVDSSLHKAEFCPQVRQLTQTYLKPG